MHCYLFTDLWLFVEALLAKMAAWNFRVPIKAILYSDSLPFADKHLASFGLLVISMAKNLIWSIRCQVRFENKIFTPANVVTMFKGKLAYRCKIDFLRFSRVVFRKVWCYNNVYCKVNKEDRLVIC